MNSKRSTASERKGNSSKGFKDFHPEIQDQNSVLTVLSVPSLLGSGEGEQKLEEEHRVTLLIRNSAPLAPYSRTLPRALWRS